VFLPDFIESGGDFACKSGKINKPYRHSPDSELGQVLRDIEQWPLPDPPGTEVEGLPRSLGQYELLELIGRGGMARVYRARHLNLQRTVAIKLLNVPAGQVDRSLARLEREIAVVGQLHHPAIVAATDAGRHEGTPYLVTEFIDGLNLSQLTRAVPAGPYPRTADACEVVRVAALGLAHAHSQGVTHRDIKPSNLMIDRRGQVKILDFGLVHLEGWQDEALELTTVGQLLGTLDYMAPEQADKATAVDHRSDVYALGATLFRLLCGRAPYAASLYQSPLEKLRLLAMTQPPQVLTLRPDLDPQLATLIDQTLSRDPAQRPPSAAHLAEALLPFCSDPQLSAWVQWALAHPPAPRLPEPGGECLLARPAVTSPGQLAAEVPTDDRSPQPQPARGGRQGSGGRWWKEAWLAAAGAAGIWLGILLILDTQKGQLVIESESADVRVTLRQDGQSSESLQLQPGLNQTRVYAGTYQIEIDGPADLYQLDRDSVVIKRGEVVLARVTRKPAAADPTATGAGQTTAGLGDRVLPLGGLDPTAAASQAPASEDGQPTYQGFPFSHWANIVRHERDGEVRSKAFANLQHFHVSEAYLRQSRQLFLEAILQSHRQESPGIERILVSAPAAYRLGPEQWQAIATSLQPVDPAKQIDSLRLLGYFVQRSPLSDDGQSLQAGVVTYLEIVKSTVAQQRQVWNPGQRHELWRNVLRFGIAVEKELRLPSFIAELRTNLRTALESLDVVDLIRKGQMNFDPIESEPLVRSLVTEALLDAVPTSLSPDWEMAQWLAMAQRVAFEMPDEQRQRLRSPVENWLANATIESLTQPIADFSRLGDPVYMNPDDGWLSKAGRANTSLLCLSAARDSHAVNLVVREDAILNRDVGWPDANTARFTVVVERPPTIGELLVSTWLQLQPLGATEGMEHLERWLDETRPAYDAFWRRIFQQSVDHPTLRSPHLYLDFANVWITERRGRQTHPDNRMAMHNLSAWEIARALDSLWESQGLGGTESISLSPMRRYRIRNPREPGGDSWIELSISSADLDRDGQVSKDEWFRHLSGMEPLQQIESISPEEIRDMLWHLYLQTVLKRPLPLPNTTDTSTNPQPDDQPK
jgi:tRNA A-37 threonylcarbamoyl transferase component Bud32